MLSRKIIVSISDQLAHLMDGEKTLHTYPVSTSGYGTGTEPGSNKTPLGRLKIHKKIGGEHPLGAVFKWRLPTGEVCTEDPRSPLWQSAEDLILTRILWLEGNEEANANTRERYIYFHGTNQEHLIGQPVSHGCIRLKNRDMVELFDLVSEGTEVLVLS